MPKISIIIPVCNSESYIEECIFRIVHQTMNDIEVLAFDNGSTDKSLDLLEQLSNQYKGKIRVFSEIKKTTGAIKNMGIQYASGDWLQFTNSTHLFERNILEKMNQVILSHNVSLIRGISRKKLGPIKIIDACNWSGIRRNVLIDIEKNKDYLVTEKSQLDNKLIKRNLIEDLRFAENRYEDLSVMPAILTSSKQIFHMEAVMYEEKVKSIFEQKENLIDFIDSLDLAQIEIEKKELLRSYRDQIESFYAFHILHKVSKIMFLNVSYHKKQMIISTLLGILDYKCPNWEDNKIIKYYQYRNPFFAFSMSYLEKFIKKEYRNIEEADIPKRLQL